MNRRRSTLAIAVAVAFMSATASTANAGRDPSPPASTPLIPGARVVQVRETTGRLGTYTSLPPDSVFSTHGGAGSVCDGVAAGDDPATLDVVEESHPIQSTAWLFVEGAYAGEGLPQVVLPADAAPTGLAALSRTFSVYCHDSFWFANFKGTIQVPVTDPAIDPHRALPDAYDHLQLAPLFVWRNRVINRWGGLVVRAPVWMAVESSGWRQQRSTVVPFRGWLLALYANPKALTFDVSFVPDPERPTPAWSGTVPCVTSGDAVAAFDGAAPQVPDGFAEFGLPGVGPDRCVWTPGGPGKVTVTAHVTFAVTFWVSGATEAQPDYVWSSTPETFTVGELRAVNTNG